MTKKVTSGAGLLHFSGADQTRFFIPAEMGDWPALRWLRNPACRQAFCADRTAILQRAFARFAFWWRLGCVLAGHFSGRTAILEFFLTRKVAELAKSLAQDVAKRYPPAIANNPVPMVSQQRLSDILEEVFTRAANFSRENKPGWYKRAKLGYEFRWELKEMGYDEKFIDVATEGLIVYVTRDPSPKT